MSRWSRDANWTLTLLVFVSLGLAAGRTAADMGTARAGLQLAEQAADAWADDARLVWVENDAPLDAAGRAEAWGFLFWSSSQGAMRSWSVRSGKIDAAEDHAVTARAPALEVWVDSDAVIQGARSRARESCAAGCALQSLLLVHGVFDAGTAWVAVFTTPDGPNLYVVCDAASGRVLRDWRG